MTIAFLSSSAGFERVVVVEGPRMGVEGLCVLVAHSGGPLEYDRPMSLLFCAENGHEMEAGCDAAWANHDHLWLWIRCWRTDVPVTLAGVTGAEAH